MFLLAAAAALAAAPPTPPITRQEIAAHVRFLADDLLEGRGIGERGGLIAEKYLEAQFRAFGLAPAFGESYQQEIALRQVQPDTNETLEFRAGDGRYTNAKWGTHFVAAFPREGGEHTVDAELVYVGYGIDAPAYEWDDYKGVDVRGKVLVMQVNEPGREDAKLFEGPALTYYGRWTYKFEEAARRGAAGVLLVHTTPDAGYGWEVVRNSWSRRLVFDPGREDLLPFEGWITQEAAEALGVLAGHDIAQLRDAAETRAFRPVPLGVRLKTAAAPKYVPVTTHNVAGVARGRAPAAAAKAVVVSAHHDHLGFGPPENGDVIYNGAIDNGSALAVMLAVARSMGARQGQLDADVIFLAAAGEEEGLLGSAAFMRRPPRPAARMMANVNLEASSVWGETNDLVAIGARLSEFDDAVAAVAKRRGMRIAPEPVPEQGYFFRSDQVSFARAGVPGIWFDVGESLAGQPAEVGHKLREEYRTKFYHRPADQFDPTWDLGGAAQLGSLTLELLAEIDRRGEIRWKPGAPFKR